MSISRLGGYVPPFQPSPDTPRPADNVTQTDQMPPQQQLPAPLPHLRRFGLGQAAKRRAGGRKKRDADDPHGADLAAESEDLLMMLEQHLLRDDKDVAKSGERNARDQQSSQQRDPGGGFAGQHAPADGKLPGAVPWTMRLVPAPPRDETDLLTQWRAAGRSKGGGAPLLRAQQALLALPAASRRAGATDAGKPASPTYPILAIMREFLAIPEAERTRHATLAGVRDRLLAATAPAGAGGAGRARALSDAEESLNLLLPIVLLNLGRHRTREGRAIGMSSLAALIRRGRGW